MLIKTGLRRCCRFFTALLLVLVFPQIVFSQSSPLSSSGGVDTHLYKSDNVLLEATAMDDGGASLEQGKFTAGMSMLHSPFLSIFSIPLKYDLNDNFQVSFSLPYLTKTLVYNDNHYIKNGYGDTMFGVTGFIKPSNLYSSSTTARITLPTGNVNAVDLNYYIAMGYGGYTASLQESLSFNEIKTGYTVLRFFVSGIVVYYFNSTQQSDQMTKYNYDTNFAWSLMGGVEFSIIENLSLEFKVNYIDVKSRRYKIETTPSTPAKWTDANDSVKQVNMLPFIKYKFLNDISGQLGIIYPLKSIQDSGAINTYDAEWKIVGGIEKRFDNCTSSLKTNEKSAVKPKKKF